MTALAALLAGSAILLCRPPGRWLTRQRLALTIERRRVPRPAGLVAVSGVAVVSAWLVGLSGPHVVLALTVCGVGAFALRHWRVERLRRRRRERRAEVSEAVGLMSAELRAGMLPQRVLAGLAPDFGFLGPAARAAGLGGDVPAALRAASDDTGAELLGELAGAWLVAERAGRRSRGCSTGSRRRPAATSRSSARSSRASRRRGRPVG